MNKFENRFVCGNLMQSLQYVMLLMAFAFYKIVKSVYVVLYYYFFPMVMILLIYYYDNERN